MAETRWDKIKRWWITSDPDDVAREEHRLATERREIVTAAYRPASSVLVDEPLESADRYQRRRHIA